jgi:hypothetical protein
MSTSPKVTVLSNWATLVEGLEASPLAFYSAVEEALARRQVPQTQNSRTDYKEAGAFSANREYLHVRREKLSFDICGAPFGTGFFFSWWFGEERPYLNPILKVLALFGYLVVLSLLINASGLMLGSVLFLFFAFGGMAAANMLATDGQFDDGIVRALPILGTLYEWLFEPATYYRLDSMRMFQESVHNAVLEVIDGMTAAKGLRLLAGDERKPVMHKFYDRNQ